MKKRLKLSWIIYSLLLFGSFLFFYKIYDRKNEGYTDPLRDTLCKDSFIKNSMAKIEAAAAMVEYARRKADTLKQKKLELSDTLKNRNRNK